MEGAKVKLEIRIDWSEIDLLGHINNLSILKYVQAGRVNYLETLGLLHTQTEIKTGPILASTSCQFIKPLFYPGKVIIYSKADNVKNTSFRIQHEIRNDKDEIIAEAQDIIVNYNFTQNIKLPLPDNIKNQITKL